MFCKYCGSKLEEGSFHCAQCGRSSDKLPCVNCGCELDAGAERCPRCYKRQPKTPCNKCGNKLDADMAFCPLCGERRLRRVRGSDSKLPIIAALTALAVVLTVTIVEFIPRDQEAVTVSGPAAGPLATPGRTDDPAQNEDEYESGGEDDPENTPRESNEKIEERTDDPEQENPTENEDAEVTPAPEAQEAAPTKRDSIVGIWQFGSESALREFKEDGSYRYYMDTPAEAAELGLSTDAIEGFVGTYVMAGNLLTITYKVYNGDEGIIEGGEPTTNFKVEFTEDGATVNGGPMHPYDGPPYP